MMAAKQLQSIAESQFTEDEALAWAEQYYRERGSWPRRRWRVEGSQAGNSHLMTEKKARRVAAKHGGDVNQLICEFKYYPEVCKQKGRACVVTK